MERAWVGGGFVWLGIWGRGLGGWGFGRWLVECVSGGGVRDGLEARWVVGGGVWRWRNWEMGMRIWCGSVIWLFEAHGEGLVVSWSDLRQGRAFEHSM